MSTPELKELLEKTEAAIFERIGAMIDQEIVDGINAEGVYSERVEDVQRSFVAGLRSARLAATAAVKVIAREALLNQEARKEKTDAG